MRHRRQRLFLVGITVLLMVVTLLPAAAASDPIRVLAPNAADSLQGMALVAELEAWAGGSVAIEYVSYSGDDEFRAEVLGGNAPDVAIAPWPGTLVQLRAEGVLVDLTQWVPRGSLEDAFGEYLIDAADVDGSVVGVPINAFLASLVWYVPATFATHGYSVPASFADLVALSDEMVGDGFTPWCNYMGSDDATGWIGTDWIEDLLLSTEGATVYDRWVDHDVLFTDTRVATAFERFLSMINTPGYVFDRGNTLSLPFHDNTFSLDNGDCLMHKQKHFFRWLDGFNETDMASFPFPPVSSTHKDATLGSGDYIAAVSSRSEVRDLIQHIASAQWGTAALADAGYIIPNVQFDTSQYTDTQLRTWADRTHAAITADVFRFDGSDLMPSNVGSGSFWQGIRDLVDDAKPLAQVLRDIDGSWPVDGFIDDNGSVFESDIEWMAATGITKGCNPPTNNKFCPESVVTRGQMAAFLTRALNLTDRLDDPFIDDDGSVFEADIERLAAAGITKGCNPPANDRFCPDSKVTREVMAAFLVRALGYTDAGAGDLFVDDDSSIFEGDIDRLATAGVTKGCNPPTNDRFCPTGYVTRGQMAAFLHRALG